MRNSSLTRVQPVFNQLYWQDPAGGWLANLLSLATRVRAGEVALPADPAWPGPLTGPPAYEECVPSPIDYLLKLVATPALLRWPVVNGQRKLYQPATQWPRHLLVDHQDPATIALATQLLQGQHPPRWCRFEGDTHVDCRLLTPRLRLYIEGKRTEPHLTDRIEWHPGRNQVFRNLDCLRSLAGAHENYYVLLITDAATACEAEAHALGYPQAEASWPHLLEPQRRALYSRYLGFVTWQQISVAFGGLQLPDTIADAVQAGMLNWQGH